MTREEYGEAYRRGYPATRKFLSSRSISLEEAEELAHAAWVKGWEARGQLRDSSLVLQWVNRIAQNLLRATFRKRKLETLDALGDQGLVWLDFDSDIEMTKLFAACSSEEVVLLKRQLEGYSAKEIAIVEGISSIGVRVRFLRIRQKIKERFWGSEIKKIGPMGRWSRPQRKGPVR